MAVMVETTSTPADSDICEHIYPADAKIAWNRQKEMFCYCLIYALILILERVLKFPVGHFMWSKDAEMCTESPHPL